MNNNLNTDLNYDNSAIRNNNAKLDTGIVHDTINRAKDREEDKMLNANAGLYDRNANIDNRPHLTRDIKLNFNKDDNLNRPLHNDLANNANADWQGSLRDNNAGLNNNLNLGGQAEHLTAQKDHLKHEPQGITGGNSDFSYPSGGPIKK